MTKKKTKKDVVSRQQKKFCKEYCIDFNGTRAYKVAYPKAKDTTAAVNASKLLRLTKIQTYIAEYQSDLEKAAGISAVSVVKALKEFAFSDITETLLLTTAEIKELPKPVRQLITSYKHTSRSKQVGEDGFQEKIVMEEVIELKFVDKQRAFETLIKILGYNAPEKSVNVNLNKDIEKPLTAEEIAELNDKLENDF